MKHAAVHSCITAETDEILNNICIYEGVTKSALIAVLIDEFLNRSDITAAIKKARKIRAGRPREI